MTTYRSLLCSARGGDFEESSYLQGILQAFRNEPIWYTGMRVSG